VVGGLYGQRASDGLFRVVKVLVVDETTLHIRMYAQRFAELPSKLSSSDLSLGSLNDAGGFGVGHVPLSRAGFLRDGRTREGPRDASLVAEFGSMSNPNIDGILFGFFGTGSDIAHIRTCAVYYRLELIRHTALWD
jgi:hypothetical protein